MFRLLKTTALLALSLAPFALIFPNRPEPGILDLETGDNDPLPGHWTFSLLTTDGPKAGGLLTGKMLVSGSEINASKFVLGEGGLLNLTIAANGGGVQFGLPEMGLSAAGAFRGENVMNGFFDTTSGAKGVWVAVRDGQANTKIKGRYNFDVKFPSKARPPFPLGGVIEFNQDTTYIHGFTRVSPQVSGKLIGKGRTLNLEGIASGGEVFFNLGNQYLGLETTLADFGMAGSLVSIEGNLRGEWTATLINDIPDLAQSWQFLAKPDGASSELLGNMQLNQTANGILSGTFTATNGATNPVNGQVDELGYVRLNFGDFDLTGKFDYLAEKFVTGTLVNKVSGKVGSWGIRK